MRAYRIIGTNLTGGDYVAWAGSKGDASQARRALAERHGLRPLADLVVEEVEVPTSKVEFLAFLNDLAGYTA